MICRLSAALYTVDIAVTSVRFRGLADVIVQALGRLGSSPWIKGFLVRESADVTVQGSSVDRKRAM